MEPLLLQNLQISQAFDTVLRRGTALDLYASQYLNAVMFNSADSVRHKAISQLENKITDYFETVLAGDAREVGFSNARRILNELARKGVRLDLNDRKLRSRVFNDLEARTEDRLRIVQRLVNDRANTLDNRLAAYWLEPGLDKEAKLARLRAQHDQMESARRTYEKELADFAAKQRETRPRKPNLDFISKFTEDAKQDVREQARRVATDAETAEFRSRGAERFTWITVNASQACPDCIRRQGWTGDLKYWDENGRPGSGATVCKSACFCMLVPSETVDVAPGLKAGLN